MRTLISLAVATPLALTGMLFFASKAGQEHGPEAKCVMMCAPKGHEKDAGPDGIPVVTCEGGTHGNGKSCAELGEACSQEHRQGCSEYCRVQCCTCCSI